MPEALHAGSSPSTRRPSPRSTSRRHEGVHPRVGAVDVAPFVPLGDTPMAVAVAAAERLAAEVGDALRPAGLPLRAGGPAAGAAAPRRHPPRRLRGLRRQDRRSCSGPRLRPGANPPHSRRHGDRRPLLPDRLQRCARHGRDYGRPRRGAEGAGVRRRAAGRACHGRLPGEPRPRPGEHEPGGLPPHVHAESPGKGAGGGRGRWVPE